MKLPKILIIGQSFTLRDGGGITLSNLFKGYPKEKLAVASTVIDYNQNEICDNYYQLGYQETKTFFPFTLIQNKVPSGEVAKEKLGNIEKPDFEKLRNNEIRRLLKNLFYEATQKLGIYDFFDNIRLTDEFKQWLYKTNPDIIYTQLGSISIIKFINLIKQQINKPLVLHFMDDWYNTLYRYGLVNKIWRNKLQLLTKQIINSAELLLTISPAMAEEYNIRYNREFYAFHNPVDLTVWRKSAKRDWNYSKPFKILYAGRVGKVTINSLKDICVACEQLNEEGYDIIFEILTPDLHKNIISLFNKFSKVRIIPYLPHHQIPEKLASMDTLIIPFDFTEENKIFTKYSMPTKTSEYMASGTPILIYADGESALAKYAQSGNWGIVVSENRVQKLKEKIILLYNNYEIRQEIGSKAIEIAEMNHEAELVRDKFQTLFQILFSKYNAN